MKIVQVEVAAKRAAEQAPKPVKPRTKFVQLPHQRIDNSRDVVNQAGSGTLKEFKVKSTTKSFSVEVIRDGGTELKGSYEELTDKVAAYQDEDGNYLLHVTDVKFSQSIIVVVSVPSPTTFPLIYACLELT